MSWDDVDPADDPEAMEKVLKEAFAIDSEEKEVFRVAFGNVAGRKALQLLHKRFIDQPRFDPYEANSVAMGFYKEGAAAVVRTLEIQSQPQGEA